MKKDYTEYIDKLNQMNEGKRFTGETLKAAEKSIMQRVKEVGYNTVSEKHWFREGQDVAVMMHRDVFKPHMHNHNFFEMSYVYKGSFDNRIEEEKVIQKEGALIILPPQTKHQCRKGTPDTVVLNIFLKRSSVEELFLRMLSEKAVFFRFFVDAVYNINTKNAYLQFKCNEKCHNIIADIIAESLEKQLFYNDIMLSKVTELFTVLSRLYYSNHKKEDNDVEKELSYKIYNYIEDNYSNITLMDVAKAFSYSPSYISKCIKDKFNTGFSQLVSDIKLKNASRYLEQSDLSIDYIVEIVGYQDVSHFYKIFKKRYGLSPKQYRKNAS